MRNETKTLLRLQHKILEVCNEITNIAFLEEEGMAVFSEEAVNRRSKIAVQLHELANRLELK